MLPRAAIVSCCAALASCVGSAAAAPCHVIIMAGQSNMVGDFGLEQLTFAGFDYAQPQSAVLFDYNIDYVERAIGWGALKPHPEVPNSTYGPELCFGRSLDQADLPAQVAIIKVAVGGTNLASRWHPDNQGDLYDLMIDQVTRSMNDLVTLGYEPQVTGFGWVQGDGDLWVPEWTAAYEENLHELIDAVRLDLAAPQMFVMVSQTPIAHNKPADLVAIMRQAKADFCNEDPHAALVFTDDLTFRDNNIHFDGTSRLTIGQRMAQAYLDESAFGPPCPGDMDGNGVHNIDDITAFVSAFMAGDPEGDFTGDGVHNVDDIDAFVAAFMAACP